MAWNLFTALHNSPAMIRLVRLFRIRAMGDQVLLHLPVIGTTSTGVKYRLERLEAIFLADAFFWGKHFSAVEKYDLPFNRFADLGANRGFFALHLMHLARQNNLPAPHGICVEANPVMIEVAQANFRRNNLANVFLEHGVAGVAPTDSRTTVDFFLNDSDMASSLFSPGKSIALPRVETGKCWTRHFGPEPCDLLKLDIEGSEGTFLDLEADFMQQVRSAIVEYHEPMTLRTDIETKMRALGFDCLGQEDGAIRPAQLGALYFKRRGE